MILKDDKNQMWEQCSVISTNWKHGWFARRKFFKATFYFGSGIAEYEEEWESKHYRFDEWSLGPAEALDYLGSKGWEVIQINHPRDNDKALSYNFSATLKRPLD